MPLCNDFKEIWVKSVKGNQIPELSLFFGGLFGFPVNFRIVLGFFICVQLFTNVRHRIVDFLETCLYISSGKEVQRFDLSVTESLERIVILKTAFSLTDALTIL